MQGKGTVLRTESRPLSMKKKRWQRAYAVSFSYADNNDTGKGVAMDNQELSFRCTRV